MVEKGSHSGEPLRAFTVAVSLVTYSDIGESFGGVDGAGVGLHLTVVGGLGMIAAAVVDRGL